MPIIAFLGCDGSGKSAVIDEVSAILRNEGVKVTCGHWRPRVFGCADASAGASAAENPHGQAPRGNVTSLLKLGWLWANWWGGWWRNLQNDSQSGVVLFDRYHGDLIVDPRRYRYGGPMWIARLASKLMQQPDLVLFLDAEPRILLSRKQEVPLEALQSAREQYLDWARSHNKCLVVDASQPLETVVDQVYHQICKVHQ